MSRPAPSWFLLAFGFGGEGVRFVEAGVQGAVFDRAEDVEAGLREVAQQGRVGEGVAAAQGELVGLAVAFAQLRSLPRQRAAAAFSALSGSSALKYSQPL